MKGLEEEFRLLITLAEYLDMLPTYAVVQNVDSNLLIIYKKYIFRQAKKNHSSLCEIKLGSSNIQSIVINVFSRNCPL